MGSSLEMVSRTQGHLAHDADSHEVDLLDAYDATRGQTSDDEADLA
jgi:hypothetical protein